MTMAQADLLNPHPPEFERFLYAPVGKDRNGYVVTVLSTLARLGLDPWAETADLAMLGRDAARSRLESLLSRFRDIPMLASDEGRVARNLSRLLPDSPKPSSREQGVPTLARSQARRNWMIWAALAVVIVLYQMLTLNGWGSGA